MNINIPEKYKITKPIKHDTFLINGKINSWKGEFTNVITTILSNKNKDHFVIGTTPKMDEKHALNA